MIRVECCLCHTLPSRCAKGRVKRTSCAGVVESWPVPINGRRLGLAFFAGLSGFAQSFFSLALSRQLT